MVDDHNQKVLEALLQYSSDALHLALSSIPYDTLLNENLQIQKIPTANIVIHSFVECTGMTRNQLEKLSRDYEQEMKLPIVVAKQQLPSGLAFYTLQDGRHRTVVARHRGWKTITAKVLGTTQLLPEKVFFALGDDGTYVADKGRSEELLSFLSSKSISKECEEVMQLMGVADTLDVNAIADSLSDPELFSLWKNGNGMVKDPRKLRIYEKVEALYAFGYTFNTHFGESIGMHKVVDEIFHRIVCKRKAVHVPNLFERFLL